MEFLLQVQDKGSRSRKSGESNSNESRCNSASSAEIDGLTEKEVSQPDEKPLIDKLEPPGKPSSEDSYNGTASCLPSNEREPIYRQESTGLTMNVSTMTPQEDDVATQPKERPIQPSQSTHHLETDSKQVSQLSSIGDHFRCLSDVSAQNLGNEHREEDTTVKSLVGGGDQHRTPLKEVDYNQDMPSVAETKLGKYFFVRPIARIPQGGGGSYFGKCGPFTCAGTSIIAFAILATALIVLFNKLSYASSMATEYLMDTENMYVPVM